MSSSIRNAKEEEEDELENLEELTEEGLNRCDECEYRTADDRLFRRHKKKMHKVKKATDDDSVNNKKPQAKNEESGNVFVSTKEKDLLPCRSCSAVFAHKSSLLRHARLVHKDNAAAIVKRKIVHQSEVRNGSDLAENLTVDQGKIVGDEGRKKEAKKKFRGTRKSKLPVAAAITVKKKKRSSLLCDRCGYCATTEMSLQRHLTKVHEVLSVYPCQLCEYVSNTKVGLRLHKRKHEIGIKESGPNDTAKKKSKKEKASYKCESCDYRSMTKKCLTNHVNKVHLALPPSFACTLCSHAAYSKGNLKLHVQAVHDKVKKYNCQQCHFKAFLKSNLAMHVNRVHGGIKATKKRRRNIVVERLFCPFQSTAKMLVRRHTKAMHQRKRFGCNECSFKTFFENNLARHLVRSGHVAVALPAAAVVHHHQQESGTAILASRFDCKLCLEEIEVTTVDLQRHLLEQHDLDYSSYAEAFQLH